MSMSGSSSTSGDRSVPDPFPRGVPREGEPPPPAAEPDSHPPADGVLDLAGKRVAVVGNAPTALLNTADVDGFDVVVRFNNFAIGEGFEAIGTRTDVIALPAHNRHVITGKLGRFTKDTRHILDLSHESDEKALAHYPELRELLPHATIINGRDVARRTRRELAGRALPRDRRNLPTTGLSAVAWAMRSGAAGIYLTGFSFERSGINHYFHGLGPDSRACPRHDPIRELKWIADRRDHPGLRVDDHIARRIELWRVAYLRLGSADAAYRSLSGIMPSCLTHRPGQSSGARR